MSSPRDSTPAPSVPRAADAVALLAFLTMAIAVAACAVDVPFWDEWDLLPDLQRWQAGDYRLADLWRQHNEHRVVTSRLLMIALLATTDLDLRWAMAGSVALAIVAFVLARRLLRQTAFRRQDPALLGGAIAVAGLLTASFAQWESLSWAFMQLAFHHLVGVIGGVLALTLGRGVVGWAGGVGGGVLATLSSSTGLVYWPATLPLVWIRGWRATVAWIGVGLATWLAYLHGLGLRPPERQLFAGWPSYQEAKDLLIYFGLYVGSPIAGYAGRWAAVVGVLATASVVGAILWLWHRGRTVDVAPWASLVALGIGCAALTTAGRISHGVGQALASRYVTFCTPLWLGAIGVLLLVVDSATTPAARRLALAVLAVVAVSVVAGDVVAGRSMRAAALERRAEAEALRAGAPLAGRSALYPDPEALESRVRWLAEERLSLFRDGPR